MSQKSLLPGPNGERCGNCMYHDMQTRSICKRRAPVAMSDDPRDFGVFPRVRVDNWCGDFVHFSQAKAETPDASEQVTPPKKTEAHEKIIKAIRHLHEAKNMLNARHEGGYAAVVGQLISNLKKLLPEEVANDVVLDEVRMTNLKLSGHIQEAISCLALAGKSRLTKNMKHLLSRVEGWEVQ